MFLDLKGFTLLAQQVDAELLRDVIGSTLGVFSSIIIHEGGLVEAYAGDALEGVFGSRTSSEDDTEKACVAAFGILRKIDEINQVLAGENLDINIQARIGIHCGEVVTGRVGLELDRDFFVSGINVAIAARMEQNAPVNSTLVTKEVYDLTKYNFAFEDHGEIKVKNIDLPIATYILKGAISSISDKWQNEILTLKDKIIGREKELTIINDEFKKLCHSKNQKQQNKIKIIHVSGYPGIGKSKVLNHFIQQNLAEHSTSSGLIHVRVNPASSFPYSLIREIILESLHLSDSSADLHDFFSKNLSRLNINSELKKHISESSNLVSDLILKRGSTSVESSIDAARSKFQEICFFMTKYFSLLGQSVLEKSGKPLIVILDNFTKIDSASLKVLQFAFSHLNDLPMLVFVESRNATTPEILSRFNVTDVRIQPFNKQDVKEFVDALLPNLTIDDELLEYLSESGKGNPYYIEQYLHFLFYSGIIERKENTIVTNTPLDSTTVPLKLKTLLQSRLDSLNLLEKETIQAISLFGDSAPKSSMCEIISKFTKITSKDFDKTLSNLVAKGLINCEKSQTDVRLSIVLPLLSQIAYNMLLNKNKQLLHKLAFDVLLKSNYSQTEKAFHAVKTGDSILGLNYSCYALKETLNGWSIEEAQEWYAKFSHFIEIVDESFSVENKEIILEGYRLGCLVFEHISDWKKAEICHTKGFNIAGSNTSKERLYKAQFLIHNSYVATALGNNSEALEKLYEVSQCFTEGDLKQETVQQVLAMSLYRKGWILFRNGNDTEAQQYYLLALDTLSQDDDVREKGAIYSGLALLETKNGNIEKALEFHKLSLDVKEKGGEKREITIGLVNLADTLITLKKYHNAKPHLERALGLCKQMSDTFREAAVKVNLAAVYNNENTPEAALKMLNEAIIVFKRRGYKDAIPESMFERAKALSALGRNDEAKKELTEAATIAKELGRLDYANLIQSYEL